MTWGINVLKYCHLSLMLKQIILLAKKGTNALAYLRRRKRFHLTMTSGVASHSGLEKGDLHHLRVRPLAGLQQHDHGRLDSGWT